MVIGTTRLSPSSPAGHTANASASQVVPPPSRRRRPGFAPASDPVPQTDPQVTFRAGTAREVRPGSSRA